MCWTIYNVKYSIDNKLLLDKYAGTDLKFSLQPEQLIKLVPVLVLGGGVQDGGHLGAAVDWDPASRAITIHLTALHYFCPPLSLPHLLLAVETEQEPQNEHEHDAEHQEEQEVHLRIIQT